jgi:hypothetical protein
MPIVVKEGGIVHKTWQEVKETGWRRMPNWQVEKRE